jgi:hypothetical protein
MACLLWFAHYGLPSIWFDLERVILRAVSAMNRKRRMNMNSVTIQRPCGKIYKRYVEAGYSNSYLPDCDTNGWYQPGTCVLEGVYNQKFCRCIDQVTGRQIYTTTGVDHRAVEVSYSSIGIFFRHEYFRCEWFQMPRYCYRRGKRIRHTTRHPYRLPLGCLCNEVFTGNAFCVSRNLGTCIDMRSCGQDPEQCGCVDYHHFNNTIKANVCHFHYDRSC